ncbi:hypothetical protein HME9302_02045 [Alteripontixanthobacter maritimus]|uniref:Lysozyme n=1 Tax=Alteripontixanthobacter maritimus TaxID=2161824 RepID=A0A369QD33_9SPHN|nr:glycoside hydrolase family 25 protein [Alteripontixanthobacter maritimus]RDC60829.1 hypothetical protein HME9302_02045 [Alteripontixanthobacter maritimus]
MAARKPIRHKRVGTSKTACSGWAMKLGALLLLALTAAAGWFWWDTQNWRPDEALFAEQGMLVGDSDGAVNFRTARALGAQFVYLEASDGAEGQNARFANRFEAARAARMRVGAVHRFDPCVMADGQSANFVTMVPRDADLLPPVLSLDTTGASCEERVSDAAIESEVMTLVNQIENHAGQSVILKVSPAFEEQYGLAARMDRNLWLTRTRFEPEYAGRPWLLWTANTALRSDAADEPLRWVVVRP